MTHVHEVLWSDGDVLLPQLRFLQRGVGAGRVGREAAVVGAETEVKGRCRDPGAAPEVKGRCRDPGAASEVGVWLLRGGGVVQAAAAGVSEVEGDGRAGVDGTGVLHRTIAGGEGEGGRGGVCTVK